MTKKRVGWLIFFLLLLLAVTVNFYLIYHRRINWNAYFSSAYEVNGVDLSYYQGMVDWPVLAEQIDFAFIKATEGSLHQDSRFEENRAQALEEDLVLGAYHFFSFESSGKLQAQNYIETVGTWEGMLYPVVDVEFYPTTAELPEMEVIREELKNCLEALETYYGCKPIIYTTQSSYVSILQNEFREYPLWIRNVYFKPLLLGHNWTFWQYDDQAVLNGYSGEEKYIDLNVFRGSMKQLSEYQIWFEE